MMTGEGFTDNFTRRMYGYLDHNWRPSVRQCQHLGCEETGQLLDCECCMDPLKRYLCPLHLDSPDGVRACLSCQVRDLDADEVIERESSGGACSQHVPNGCKAAGSVFVSERKTFPDLEVSRRHSFSIARAIIADAERAG